MKLVLIRHGNTFEANETPVWTGAKNDLALTKQGEQQAEALASFFSSANIIPNIIYSSNLKRTKKTAQILQKIASPSNIAVEICISDKLIEVDYGKWGGHSDEYVVNNFGEEALNNWRKYGIFPSAESGWEQEGAIESRIATFYQELLENHGEDDVVFVISSNGVLRYFLKNIEVEFEKRKETGDFKVKTGAYCILDYNHKQGKLQVKEWSKRP